ncbi:MAG: hypothetical protein EOO29_11455 [Comamonadaceae bacterium]|nr:MAG: hypothetical protein EOO29_11455 [Comamonadaceae bacterium]
MKRDAERQKRLLPQIPNWNQLDAMAQKGVVQDFIGRVVAELEHEGEEPDDWEGPELIYACGLVAASWYTAALHSVNLALTPVDARSPHYPRKEFHPTLSDLQTAHHEIESLPPIGRK